MLRLRTLTSAVFIALLTIVGSVMSLVVRVFDPSGDRICVLARLWSRIILWYCGVTIEVRHVPAGRSLDASRPYVFMSNHLSSVDIWTLLIVLPGHVRMIAKKQLGRIPLFGWAMRAGRFIFIDRGNAAKARRSIDVAKRRISGGESVLIFPEGTRSRDGRLQAFKKGGFHLALDAKVAIVPIALVGTREAMPRGSFLVRPGHVVVTIGAPVETATRADADRNELVSLVHGQIAAMLGQVSASAEPPPAADLSFSR